MSQHALDVIEKRAILEEWIAYVVENPRLQHPVSENELHFYGQIDAYEKRCLKVVVNPQKALIITAYFDRNMRKRGCR